MVRVLKLNMNDVHNWAAFDVCVYLVLECSKTPWNDY